MTPAASPRAALAPAFATLKDSVSTAAMRGTWHVVVFPRNTDSSAHASSQLRPSLAKSHPTLGVPAQLDEPAGVAAPHNGQLGQASASINWSGAFTYLPTPQQVDEPAGIASPHEGQLAQAVMPAAMSDAPYVPIGHVELHAACPGCAPYVAMGHRWQNAFAPETSLKVPLGQLATQSSVAKSSAVSPAQSLTIQLPFVSLNTVPPTQSDAWTGHRVPGSSPGAVQQQSRDSSLPGDAEHVDVDPTLKYSRHGRVDPALKSGAVPVFVFVA